MAERTGESTKHRKKSPLSPLGELEQKVQNLELQARELNRGRFGTLGTALAQLGLGTVFVIDAATGGLGVWGPVHRPDVPLILVASAIAIVRGLQNIGEVPHLFRRARDLTSESHYLRASLTRAYDDAIKSVPYRMLEASSDSTHADIRIDSYPPAGK